MKKGTITIKDIAEELNVSPSTVSRALADNPLVKPSTREAIKKLAEKYNYQPNFTALSLRSNQTRTIGIVIPQIVHEFFGLVIRGIEDFCYSNGYSCIICSTHERFEREIIDTKTLLSGRVDGLLACISRTTTSVDHFMEFEKRNIPLVFFDRVVDSIASHKVIIDDELAAYDATKHLIDRGSKLIAYVGGPKNLIINQKRFEGYQKALDEAGIRINEDLIVHSQNEDFEAGKKDSKIIFEFGGVDGVFATTDMLAIGVAKNIKEAGLKSPDDVAVVGFSNWSISSLYEPSISTVSQPGYEMGFKAAELLIEQIKHPEITHFKTVVLQTELIERDSSKKL
jgi:LacI family transcriptional regulator